MNRKHLKLPGVLLLYYCYYIASQAEDMNAWLNVN